MKYNKFLFYAGLIIVAGAILAAASFIGKAQNGGDTARQPGTALTENDFVKDPTLFAIPDAGVAVTFLENPNSISEPDDTGTVGMDIIPFKYASGMNQTFCWQDDNKESRHFMTLVDGSGTEVLRVEANGDCVTQFINQGNYEMRIQHDDSTEEVFATVFSIPEENADNSSETTLSTNKCEGCDLSEADFSNAILTNVDLHGADLTAANLSNADLSGANLSNTLLASADLRGANLTNANLSGADLTNANLSGAKFGSAAGIAVTRPAEQPELAQEEPQAADPCPAGILRPIPVMADMQDLVLSKACMVPAGTYQYGEINIINGGSLTFKDEKINFWAKSILIQNGGSLIAGSPPDPNDSTKGPIGKDGGQITFHLYGMDQGNGGKGITCKKIAMGKPVTDPMCGVDETTWNSNFPPKTNSCTPANPPLPGNDCFYQYSTLPVDTGDTTAYFGYKVIAVSYGGTLQLFGQKGATYDGTNVLPSNSGKSWVRLAKDLKGGKTQTELTVDDHDNPVDWKEGDHIVVTTTDYLPGHSEELTIKGTMKDSDGDTVINVNEQIQYPHSGTAYKYPSDISRTGIQATQAETRAAVALLTRSIRIVSGPNNDDLTKIDLDCGTTDHPPCFPVSDGYIGGHTIVRQGFKTFQVQGVEFYQLGQGGRLGHYPVHFHLARKTPPDTFVKDCSIHDSMTRFITIHGTHDVLLARNVGYMSIGHGFYLEDGTEINNKLYSNLGIRARSAADDGQDVSKSWNPRKVPGILSSSKVCNFNLNMKCTENLQCPPNPNDKNDKGVCIYPATFPYLSDWVHPTVFWFMNGWNDFEYNMAAGAGACGACYWPVLGTISGPSKNMFWTSYASIQRKGDNGGTAPIKNFTGNFCTTAMISFNTTPDTTQCHGLVDGSVRLNQIPNDLAPAPNPVKEAETNYPIIVQSLPAYTRCDGENTDCSSVAKCGEGNRENCMVTVLDKYTTSFNWNETNFSAIWLRPRWFLVQNSVITDVQQAGLTFVTGGDYTHSSVISGNWMLARKTVFIGNTQDNNPFASNAGPFNGDSGLACEDNDGNYCILRAQDITMLLSNYGVNQRFFNIYDGPSLQDSNAYLKIKKTPVKDCPFPNGQNDPSANCGQSKWMYGRVLGLPGDDTTHEGFLPNAAIAWKQPNGFYYPPAFHSEKLFFNDVDIRHFVIEPLFKPENETPGQWFVGDIEKTKKSYSTWNDDSWQNFSAIDRQTILNDDDGSLTGLIGTVSVNQDPFFSAPVETTECRSGEVGNLPELKQGTAITSPDEHITTVVYPGCALDGTCQKNKAKCSTNCPCDIKDGSQDCDWSSNCTRPDKAHFCFGVPLYRQFLTESEQMVTADTGKIRMMGPAIYGRINLTANRGVYYISTTDGPTQQASATLKNIFRQGDKYYVFLVYAKESARQTYQIYVGDGASLDKDAPQNVEAVGVNLANPKLVFDSICTKLDSTLCEHDMTTNTDFPKNWERSYDSATGILTVKMDLSAFNAQFTNARADICQPHTFCKPSGNTCECVDKNDQDCVNGEICSKWAVKDIDCPVFVDTNKQRVSRCVGFSFTVPTNGTFNYGNPQRPTPTCFPHDDWNFSWNCADKTMAQDCGHPPLSNTIGETKFCEDNTDKMCVSARGGGGPGGGGEGGEGAVGSCHSLAGAAPVQLGTAMANLLIPLVPALAVGLEVLRRKKKKGQK